MTDKEPHKKSLLVYVAEILCKEDLPHDGQRSYHWDDDDNYVEDVPVCEEHIRLARLARGPLSIAFGVGLQEGYEMSSGNDIPLEDFINKSNPYDNDSYELDYQEYES